jgi:hypothetical protein
VNKVKRFFDLSGRSRVHKNELNTTLHSDSFRSDDFPINIAYAVRIIDVSIVLLICAFVA